MKWNRIEWKIKENMLYIVEIRTVGIYFMFMGWGRDRWNLFLKCRLQLQVQMPLTSLVVGNGEKAKLSKGILMRLIAVPVPTPQAPVGLRVCV